MTYRGWQEVVGTIGVFVLLTVVFTVAIWQLCATWRAKAKLAREQEFRALAEKSVALQEETGKKLSEMDETLADMRERLRSMERILKEVE